MSELRTSEERLLDKAKRGQRITRAEAEYSMFDEPQDIGLHSCNGRVILCYGDDDVSECRKCGRQWVHGCTFDEEMS
jgi:hypothetical protein